MKRLSNTLLGLTVIALLLSSCGADSDVLSQFSKRKYLKRSKASKQYELAKVDEIKNESTKKVNVAISTDTKEVETSSETSEQIVEVADVKKENSTQLFDKSAAQLSNKISKDWSSYNRVFIANPSLASKQITTWAYSNEIRSSQRASDVVLIILCIFLPPVAVILYEDTVTGNFWLDLVLTLLFWLPGMIYAFLVCFADVSV